MFKENNEKVNKSTFITYIVSSILLFVYLIMILLIKFSNVFPKSIVSELFAIFVLVFFYISLLVSIIFGILNFVKNKNKLVRKNIIIMYILIILINVLVLVIPNAIYDNSSEKAKTKLNTKAEELLDKLQGTESHILLYNELVKIDSQLSEFDKESYVSYNNNEELYICLEYNNRIMYGTKNNLKYSNTKYCEFNVEDASKRFALESYVKEHLESKYNIKIDEVNAHLVDQFCIDTCAPNTGRIEKFYIDYNNEIYHASVELINDKIVVTDDIEFDSNSNEENVENNQEELENVSCNYVAKQKKPNYSWIGNADESYFIDLNFECEKINVSIDESIQIVFNRNDFELEQALYENYDANIYINNNLVDGNLFKYSQTLDFSDSIEEDTFSVFKFNNLYFFTNYRASQCGGANTLITDANGKILKVIRSFTYTFNSDSTFTVHDSGSCPVIMNDNKDIIYKIEDNTIREVN